MLPLRMVPARCDGYKSPISADGASNRSGAQPGGVGLHGGESGVGELLALAPLESDVWKCLFKRKNPTEKFRKKRSSCKKQGSLAKTRGRK